MRSDEWSAWFSFGFLGAGWWSLAKGTALAGLLRNPSSSREQQWMTVVVQGTPPPRACWPGASALTAGHGLWVFLWVLIWTGACYWHGVGGFMFNSSSSDQNPKENPKAMASRGSRSSWPTGARWKGKKTPQKNAHLCSHTTSWRWIRASEVTVTLLPDTWLSLSNFPTCMTNNAQKFSKVDRAIIPGFQEAQIINWRLSHT